MVRPKFFILCNLILLFVLLAVDTHAVTINCGKFEGYRFDKYLNKEKFEQSNDAISLTKTIINVEDDNTARLIILPSDAPADKMMKALANLSVGEYKGMATTVTKRLITMVFPQNAKTEVYTIYPDSKTGIITSTRAISDLIGENPKNPIASASVFFAKCEVLEKY